MKYLIIGLSLTLTGCTGVVDDKKNNSSTDVPVKVTYETCGEALRSGDSLDYNQKAWFNEEIDDPTADVATAMKVVSEYAVSMGCSANDVKLDTNNPSNCRSIIDEDLSSRICHIETNEGQFFIQNLYPDLTSVIWNRYD